MAGQHLHWFLSFSFVYLYMPFGALLECVENEMPVTHGGNMTKFDLFLASSTCAVLNHDLVVS